MNSNSQYVNKFTCSFGDIHTVKRSMHNTMPNAMSNHVPRSQPTGTTDFTDPYASQTPYPVGSSQGGMPTATIQTAGATIGDQPPPYPESSAPPLGPPAPPPDYYSKVEGSR
uniref:LITAF domain-containing protein n=2 Tax=Trichobilharzia regenti TaxID=157069 RepID=A0AA85J067_TRIRE|nr:unnamed protein product [Trichobilharzia regenti]